jgi:hypothetical protein
MNKRKQITADEAKRIGDSLYIDWDQVDLEQFRQGLMGNRRQRARDPETGLTYDAVLLSGRVVLDHMQRIPDYFIRLAKLRAEVRQYEVRRRQQDSNDGSNVEVFSEDSKEERE